MSTATATNTSNIESRIRKLLALAIDQQGTPEGTAAANKAADLMHKYGVAANNYDDDGYTKRRIEEETVTVPKSMWRYQLAWALGPLCGCVVLASNGKVSVYGYYSDRQRLIYLLDSLTNQCMLMTEVAKASRKLVEVQEVLAGNVSGGGDSDKYSKFDTDAFRKSFALGVNAKVRDILEAQESHAQDQGYALVSLSTIAQVKGSGVLPKITNIKYRYREDAKGFNAGKNSSLGGGIGDGNSDGGKGGGQKLLGG